jgi:hypothetical protein
LIIGRVCGAAPRPNLILRMFASSSNIALQAR